MISPKILIPILFAIAIIAAAFMNREKLPECEKPSVSLVYSPTGEPHALIDMENMGKFTAMVQGLSNGTCRI